MEEALSSENIASYQGTRSHIPENTSPQGNTGQSNTQ
jgi:hypothetical protein